MKRFIILSLLLCVAAVRAMATDVQIAAAQVPTIYAANLPAEVTYTTCTLTNGSTTVTCSAALRSDLRGKGGFTVEILGSLFGVASVPNTINTTQFTLSTAWASISGVTAVKFFPYLELRIYADKAFQPLGATYIVQPGTPGSGAWYRRTACSVINSSGQTLLYIPAITLPATTDAPSNNTAKYTAGFYRPDGSLVQYYQNFAPFALPPTGTSWTAIQNYNVGAVIVQDSSTYTRSQIDARFPSCTTGQMLYYAATGHTQTCLTLGANLSIAGGVLSASGGSGGALADPGANGMLARTATNVTVARTLLGTTNRLTITNGDGVGGAPVFDVGSNIIDKSVANTYPAGAKQTFVPSGTFAGLNIGATASHPGTQTEGDIWKLTGGNSLYAYLGGANRQFAFANGTVNTIPLFSTAGSGLLSDSPLSYNPGTALMVMTGDFSTTGNYRPKGVTTNWPGANGVGCLNNDGAGNYSWGSCGSGSIGPGTVGKLAKFGTTTTIADSIMSESGAIVTVAGKLDTNSTGVQTTSNAGFGRFRATNTSGAAGGLYLNSQLVVEAEVGLTTGMLLNTQEAAAPIVFGVFGAERLRANASGVVVTSSSAGTSGLTFTNLTSTAPAGTSTAYLAVDAGGMVVRAAAPSGGGGGSTPVATHIASGYTAITTDWLISASAASAALTVTYFAAAGNSGKIVETCKSDTSSNTVSVSANGTYTLYTPGACVRLISNGSTWLRQ